MLGWILTVLFAVASFYISRLFRDPLPQVPGPTGGSLIFGNFKAMMAAVSPTTV